MTEIKMLVPFVWTEIEKEGDETFRIIFADVTMNSVIVEVSIIIDEEIWTTKREYGWKQIFDLFDDRVFKYIE